MKTTATTETKQKYKNKIIQLLTEVPELVSLGCSLTHVLQTAKKARQLRLSLTKIKSWMDWGYL